MVHRSLVSVSPNCQRGSRDDVWRVNDPTWKYVLWSPIFNRVYSIGPLCPFSKTPTPFFPTEIRHLSVSVTNGVVRKSIYVLPLFVILLLKQISDKLTSKCPWSKSMKNDLNFVLFTILRTASGEELRVLYKVKLLFIGKQFKE